MAAEVAYKLEVLAKARIAQHFPSVAAHWKYSPGFDQMMFIQQEAVRMIGNAAFVNHRLTVIFAVTFQITQFKQTVGCGEETNVLCALCQLLIGDF